MPQIQAQVGVAFAIPHCVRCRKRGRQPAATIDDKLELHVPCRPCFKRINGDRLFPHTVVIVIGEKPSAPCIGTPPVETAGNRHLVGRGKIKAIPSLIHSKRYELANNRIAHNTAVLIALLPGEAGNRYVRNESNLGIGDGSDAGLEEYADRRWGILNSGVNQVCGALHEPPFIDKHRPVIPLLPYIIDDELEFIAPKLRAQGSDVYTPLAASVFHRRLGLPLVPHSCDFNRLCLPVSIGQNRSWFHARHLLLLRCQNNTVRPCLRNCSPDVIRGDR